MRNRQAPLQPLMDNLESQTYETFEQDPVKYRNYEEAMKQALMDTPEEKITVLMVVRSHDDGMFLLPRFSGTAPSTGIVARQIVRLHPPLQAHVE